MLKEQIKVEAQDLNRIVEEQRKSDLESHSHLSAKIETLQTRLARAEEDALIDPLTQVANRGCFDDSIQKWIQRLRSTGPASFWRCSTWMTSRRSTTPWDIRSATTCCWEPRRS